MEIVYVLKSMFFRLHILCLINDIIFFPPVMFIFNAAAKKIVMLLFLLSYLSITDDDWIYSWLHHH